MAASLTLEPIRPMTISSVDSGNLAASFYTLRTGCRGMLREPLLDPALFAGIRRSLAAAYELAWCTRGAESSGSSGGDSGCCYLDRVGA